MELRKRPRQRRVDRRNFLVRDLLAKSGSRAFTRFRGFGFVDVLGRNGHVCDDRHTVMVDVDEPLPHREILLAARLVTMISPGTICVIKRTCMG